MPTAKKVYCTSSNEPKRRNNRLQRHNGRYLPGASVETEGACRVVVDYTPLNAAVTRTRPTLPEPRRTSAPTAASSSVSHPNNSLPSSSSSTRPVRLPPPRLVPPCKRRRILQQQRRHNVTLPSWEAFHRTQQQVESGKKSQSPLDALASVAMREAVSEKQPAHGATSKLNIRLPTSGVHVPLKKETYAEQLTRQKEQGHLIYLQDIELQKAAALQEIHDANIMAQAKQHMFAQQQAAALQSGYVNLVMDYNNVPQLQLLPQGLEAVSFIPQQRLEYFHQPATATLLAQHHLADPRIFIGNGHFPGAATITAPDVENKLQPTASLNEHVASIWQKYNCNTDVSKLLNKNKEMEGDAGAVPLKKRKMEQISSLSAAHNAASGGC